MYLLVILYMFWHINRGIEDIIVDYVHHEITKNVILLNLRCLWIILMKDFFIFFFWGISF